MAIRNALRISVVGLALVAAGLAAEGEYRTANNTDVELIPPPGFAPVTHFDGFQNVGKRSSIVVQKLPHPYEAYERQVTAEALARQGAKLLSKEVVKRDSGKAFLCQMEQSARGEKWRKWQLYLGDEKGAVRVEGVYPIGLEKEMSAVLKKAVLTARRAGAVGEVRTAALPFEVKPAAPLELAKKIGTQRIYTEGGHFPRASRKDLVLVVGPSHSNVGVADRKKYAIERM
ncbi:MAG: hypothetical protein ACYTDY_07710, partial [Planctomycetota bacterium]